MKQTALVDKHIALGAKMVEFAGYNMPVSYTGLNDEHHTVRNSAGIFDVSHMGEFYITGKGALPLIQKVTMLHFWTIPQLWLWQQPLLIDTPCQRPAWIAWNLMPLELIHHLGHLCFKQIWATMSPLQEQRLMLAQELTPIWWNLSLTTLPLTVGA